MATKEKKVIKPKTRKRALILSGGGARGAYHAGVWKYLQEMNWTPDLICGTSVGAITASGIGSGLSPEALIRVWRTIERNRVFRISLWRHLRSMLWFGGYTPLVDTEPLRQYITEMADIEALRKSKIEIIITAVNILNAQLKFFNNKVIDIEHVLASSAIPILFQWQYVDGEPYWDGGVMANTPIQPALERNAREIIVVLLSPVGGARMDLPRNRRQAVERVFEQAQIGSYEAFMANLAWEHKRKLGRSLFDKILQPTLTLGDIKISTVAPSRMLGFSSLLNFSSRQTDTLIQEGYTDAKNQLREHFSLDQKPI